MENLFKSVIILLLALAIQNCEFEQLHINETTGLPGPDFSFPTDMKECAKSCGVTFTNTSTNATSYLWDFGDGSTSMNPDPTHVYEMPGTYTVTLEATNENGNEMTSKQIEITRAASFSKTFGGTNYDLGEHVLQLTDGSFAVLGSMESNDFPGLPLSIDFQVFFIRTDQNGDIINQRAFGTNSNGAFANGVSESRFGDIIVVGQDKESWRFAFDPTNESEGWDHDEASSFRGDDVLILPNDLLILVGGDASALELKRALLPTGKVDFSQPFESYKRSLVSATIANDGNILVVTHDNSSGSIDTDPILIKFDLNFNELWMKNSFGGASTDRIFAIETDDAGNIYMVGESNSFTNGGRDIYVIKADSEGNFITQNHFGFSGDDEGKGVVITEDNEIVIAGTAENPSNGSKDIYLLNLDADLEENWSKFIGGSFTDRANDITLTQDCGFLITGESGTSSGSPNVWLIKTDFQGNFIE